MVLLSYGMQYMMFLSTKYFFSFPLFYLKYYGSLCLNVYIASVGKVSLTTKTLSPILLLYFGSNLYL